MCTDVNSFNHWFCNSHEKMYHFLLQTFIQHAFCTHSGTWGVTLCHQFSVDVVCFFLQIVNLCETLSLCVCDDMQDIVRSWPITAFIRVGRGRGRWRWRCVLTVAAAWMSPLHRGRVSHSRFCRFVTRHRFRAQLRLLLTRATDSGVSAARELLSVLHPYKDLNRCRTSETRLFYLNATASFTETEWKSF